jgi:hypothetical protein
MLGIWLSIEDVESMLIECLLYRNKYEASSRRRRDGARARKATPRKITLDNVNENDQSPGG